MIVFAIVFVIEFVIAFVIVFMIVFVFMFVIVFVIIFVIFMIVKSYNLMQFFLMFHLNVQLTKSIMFVVWQKSFHDKTHWSYFL